MNNPFLRLKRYSVDGNTEAEAKENYATESLAACLVFSQALRKEFVRFLFGNKIPDELGPLENCEIDVTTQENLGEFGCADLLLKSPGFTTIIEVKVSEKEDQRHAEQLRNYWTWLENETNPFLFTLVKDSDRSFAYQDFHVRERHTWRELCKHFENAFNKEPTSDDDIDRVLVANLCGFLESEGIVSNYEMKNLLSYSDGLKAQKALDAVLNKVGNEFENGPPSGRFATKFEKKSEAWPLLKIQNISSPGVQVRKNQAVWLWFTVPPIWDADRNDFYPELILWHADAPDDAWLQVKRLIHPWREILEAKGYQVWLQRDYRTDHKILNSTANLEKQPVRIYAYLCPKAFLLAQTSQNHTQSEVDLISLLVDKVKDCFRILDQLPAA
jgi:hypothetical protein